MGDTQILTIALAAVPTMLAVLVGILINNSRLSDTNANIRELRGHMDARFTDVDHRFDDVDRRFDEMRDLWRWVDVRMNGRLAASEGVADDSPDVEFPIILAPERLKAPVLMETGALLRPRRDDIVWDAGL